MRLVGITAAVFLLPAVVACTGSVSPADVNQDADSTSATAAVVTVERRTASGDATSDATSGEAVARFMRVHSRAAVDGDEALRIVGAAVDLPVLGSCVSLSTPGAPKDAASTVQLLDVGSVSMEANGVRTELGPRQVPDVVDVVSGVVYARATTADGLPDGTPYALHIAGSAGLDSFSVAARAPADLIVAGAESGALAFSADAPAEITWDRGADGDVVYIDVTASAQNDVGRLPVIRCAFADAGRAVLGASAFAAGDEGTLEVHRLHRESFEARGIDSGEVRFDFARVVTFTRR